MEEKTVKDLMIPLDDCAVVDEGATLYDAIAALERAQSQIPEDRHPHRAILVKDATGHIVGKIGQLAFLRGLEIGIDVASDISTLERAGVDEELITSIRDHRRTLIGSLEEFTANARSVRVSDIMHPVTESIDEYLRLTEAIHRIVEWQQLSLLVTRGNEVVGLLRLSDLFEMVAENIRER
jgi:CBS domain containing-hemolysin-like protein